MQDFLIFVLVCVIIVLAYKAFKKPKAEPGEANQEPDEPAFGTLEISAARRGDTVVIRGAGEDYADLHLTIDRVATYVSGRDRWGEVSGVVRNERVSLEWTDEDGLEIWIDRGLRMQMRDLDVGEDELLKFDEEQSDRNCIAYEGDDFHYVESREATCSENGGAAEGFYLWDFVNSAGRMLWVEKWEDEPFEVGLSTPIDPATVTLFRA